MKKLRSVVLGMSLLAAQFAYAQMPPQTTDRAETTVSNATWVPVEKMSPHAIPRAAGNMVARITHTPIFLPDSASPNWQAAADKVIADALAGTIPTQTNAIVNPGDYSIARTIYWYNLVSESTNQTQLWDLVEVESVSGNDDVDLADYVHSFTSSEGALNGSLTFADAAYTPRAPLILASGGAPITSGAATQKGKKFFLLVHSKLFTGGSQSALDSVRTWVMNHTPYIMTFTGQFGGDSSSVQIGTAFIPHDSGFTLDRKQNGTNDTFTVVGADPYATYQVIWNANLTDPMSSWTVVGTISGTNSVTIPAKTGDMGFFAAKR